MIVFLCLTVWSIKREEKREKGGKSRKMVSSFIWDHTRGIYIYIIFFFFFFFEAVGGSVYVGSVAFGCNSVLIIKLEPNQTEGK